MSRIIIIHLFPLTRCRTVIGVWLLPMLIMICAVMVTMAMDLDLQRMQNLAEQRYGLPGRHAVNAWRQLQADCPVDQQLKAVNDFFNQRTRYVDDRLTWGKTDYWATPLETLGLGQGDCEDFSFAKYVTLQQLGIPTEQLRLTYVKARIITTGRLKYQAHMVLGYYPSPTSSPLILDNLEKQVLPASERSDLFPVFSFNTKQLWLQGKRDPAGDSSSRLSHWRDVLRRMREEGLH